jgi:hypothetical protein
VVRRLVNLSLGVLVAWLSVPVVLNLLSSKQVMNTSFSPLRIVNTYGAFGRYGQASPAPPLHWASAILFTLDPQHYREQQSLSPCVTWMHQPCLGLPPASPRSGQR